MKIGRSLGLAMAPGQMVPSIFILDTDRRVAWMQLGRNGRYFGDKQLVREIGLLDMI